MSRSAAILCLFMAFVFFSLAHLVAASQMAAVLGFFVLAGVLLTAAIAFWAHHCYQRVAGKGRRS